MFAEKTVNIAPAADIPIPEIKKAAMPAKLPKRIFPPVVRGTVPNQVKTKKAVKRVPPVINARIISPVPKGFPTIKGQKNLTRIKYTSKKLPVTLQLIICTENKNKEAIRVNKLNLKAGITDPESQIKETKPFGIDIPIKEKIFSFKNEVIVESKE